MWLSSKDFGAINIVNRKVMIFCHNCLSDLKGLSKGSQQRCQKDKQLSQSKIMPLLLGFSYSQVEEHLS